MVEYIFSLTDKKKKEIPIPTSGQLKLNFNDNEPRAQYTIVARYTDKGGNGIRPLSTTDIVNIRSSVLRPIDADAHPGFQRFGEVLTSGGHKSHLFFKEADMTNVSAFDIEYSARNSDGIFEVRMDSRAGPVIASVPFKATGENKNATVSAVIEKPVSGRHNLYFFITRKQKPYNESANIREIRVVTEEEKQKQ
jgi:cytochrome c